jgi:hypothetical protein
MPETTAFCHSKQLLRTYSGEKSRLETKFRASTSLRGDYQHLYSWLVEMVSHILRLRQTLLTAFIERNITILEGIARLAESSAPLWIFSLNHDVIVECVAAAYGVPVHSGFNDNIVSFPRRDRQGVKIGEIKAETLAAANLANGMTFPTFGTKGINLLKVHGALDVFTFRNGADMAKLLPAESSVAGVLEVLRAANEDLIYFEPLSSEPVKATNEIAYADEAGEMQFLRRSLLAGAYKFDSSQSQVLPIQMLAEFTEKLNAVQCLHCIGYGFGDKHINDVLLTWIEADTTRKLSIVSPRANLPPFLSEVPSQVVLSPEKASAYLDRVAGITRTIGEVLQQRLSRWVLRTRRSTEAKQAFQEFCVNQQSQHLHFVRAKIAGRPMKDGDLDCEVLAKSVDELAQEAGDELRRKLDASLEKFLAENELKPFD